MQIQKNSDKQNKTKTSKNKIFVYGMGRMKESTTKAALKRKIKQVTAMKVVYG